MKYNAYKTNKNNIPVKVERPILKVSTKLSSTLSTSS